jgi:hypothetical protein
MASVCSLCASDPSTPVFRKVGEKPTHVLFYTHPSKVKKTYSAEQIIQHYTHRLEEKGAKPWVWIFDGAQFDTDHIMELRTGQGIAELLKGAHSESLVEIKVINPTIHLKVLLKVIQPLMEDGLRAKLTLLDDRPRSILEFL